MSRLRVVSLLAVVLAALYVLSPAALPSYSSDDVSALHNVSIAAPGIPAHFDSAQQFGAVCEDQVQAALEQVTTACESVGRNEACYGNSMIDTRFRDDVQPVRFRSSGDIAALSLLDRIQTQPYSALMGTWGIALLKAQVNLPDALPGQNVTFLLFGDTTVDNPTPDMRAVTIRTRIGGVECEELPDSALIIQAPQGQRVTMTINGARVTLGSTAHITAVMNDEMIISTLEGEVVVEAFDVVRVVPPGAEVWMPLGGEDGLTVEDEPADIRPYDEAVLEILPFVLLERAIENVEAIDPALLEPTAEADATANVDATEAAEENTCPLPLGWLVYIVQPGDTLETLSSHLRITRRELRLANCIPRSNARLIEGRHLYVPFEVVIEVPSSTDEPTEEATEISDDGTPSPQATNIQPTATSVVNDPPVRVGVSLSANPMQILPRECVQLGWNVESGGLNYQLFLNGEDVTNDAGRTFCLFATTTFFIQASFADGQVASDIVTIEVVAPQSPPLQPTQPLPTLRPPTLLPPTLLPPTLLPPTLLLPTLRPPTQPPADDCDDSGVIGYDDDCDCDDSGVIGYDDDCDDDDDDGVNWRRP